MNKIENLSAILAMIETLVLSGALDDQQATPPVVINGYTLVEMTDGNMVYDEGVRQRNALVMPQMRAMIADRGDIVFSMRDAISGASVLSLSVNSDNIVRHVVGKHNAAPSADQLDTLQQLLAEQHIELQYNPFTMY